jgi:hypothetical protein
LQDIEYGKDQSAGIGMILQPRILDEMGASPLGVIHVDFGISALGLLFPR